jgi:hypothetical protein
MRLPSSILKCIGGLVAIMAAVFLFSFEPGKGGIFPPCPFFRLTHFYCPGCGTTRALHSLLHGDVLRSLDMNPLMVLSIPFVLLLAWKPSLGSKRYVPEVVGVILVAYGILRNFPAISFLAP